MEFSGFTLTLLQLKNQPAEDFRLTRLHSGSKTGADPSWTISLLNLSP